MNLKNEIDELVSLYAQRKKGKSKKIPNDFNVEEKKDTFNERIKLREKIFHLSIGRDSPGVIVKIIKKIEIRKLKKKIIINISVV